MQELYFKICGLFLTSSLIVLLFYIWAAGDSWPMILPAVLFLGGCLVILCLAAVYNCCWTHNHEQNSNQEQVSDQTIEDPSDPNFTPSSLLPSSLLSRNYQTNTSVRCSQNIFALEANLYVECPEPYSSNISSAPHQPDIYYIENFQVSQRSHESERVKYSIEDDIEEESCVICFGGMNPRCRLFPCGHASFCVECGLKIGNQDIPRCPLCRTEIIAVNSERTREQLDLVSTQVLGPF